MGLTKKEYWFWLCNIHGIGNGFIKILLDNFLCPFGVYEASKGELERIHGLGKERIDSIIRSREPGIIRKAMEEMEEKGIHFLYRDEEGFPEALREIPDSPWCIYYKGNLPDIRFPSIAVVGARECTGYGIDAAKYLSAELSKRGVQIISGMARGIDSAAHRGALLGNMPTFAVLGCGVDVCYPQENYYLYDKIENGGGIISEYPPGTKPCPGNFPFRNRIIAGLSCGILVVEARKKSGSLITASLGLNQGKDIFAVPGRIGDSLSCGCNELIKDGAGLVASPEDILYALEIRYPYLSGVFGLDNKERKAEDTENGKKAKTDTENGKKAKTDTENGMKAVKDTGNGMKAKTDAGNGMKAGTATGINTGDDEKRVYSFIDIEPKHIERIIEESGLSVTRTAECIFELEMKGLICQCGQNSYRRFLRQ